MNNVEKLITALTTPFQDVENVAQDVLNKRGIDTAEGEQLNVIGRLVGQLRNGLDDDTYRRYCRARVTVHRSKGTPEDILKVAKLVLGLTTETGVVILRCIWNATFVLEIRGITVDDTVAAALQELLCAATSAGVRIVIVFSVTPLAALLRLDKAPGLDTGIMARAIDSTSTV